MEKANIFFDMSSIRSLGKNAIIGRTVRIRRPELASIGAGSIIDDFTYISTRLEVGRYSHIGAGTHIIGGKGAGVSIGNFANIAPGCNIIAGQHDYRGGGLMGPAIPEKYCSKGESAPVKIGDHALLGCGTVVLPGVEIPEGMATGAYTILKKKEYKPWTLYVGPSAREIGARQGGRMKEAASRMESDGEYWL
ncbi:2,3,4,5-tetrahydropyridine-2,6-dicarboxylate N-acetyltransferase [uncultured archaeon]|nr:2,3,4,5-tetrahydropyridine-2,6-dicarboxylate N-acetyltransferase [uncultured archaeon]